MKKLITYIVLSLSLSGLFAQSNAGSLWFMPEVYQANRLNPAFQGDRNVVIGLPSLYWGLANSSFSFQDIFDVTSGGEGIFSLPSIEGVKSEGIDGLALQNYSRVWLDMQAFALGIKIKKAQIGFDVRARGSGYLRYSGQIAQLLWYGNGAFVDETVQLGPDFQVDAFVESAFRFNMPIAKKWYVGGALKRLSGIQDFSNSRNKISLYTDPEYYQLTATTNYQVNSSGIVAYDEIYEAILDPDFWLNPSGSGLALDLGAKFKFNEQWTFSASLLDMGRLNWKEGVDNWKSEGSFTYEGLPLSSYTQGDSGYISLDLLSDSLIAVFSPIDSENPYATSLPTRFLIGATWEPVQLLRFGALYEREWFRGQNFDALSLHGAFRWKDRIYLGLTYTLQETFQNRLGAQVMGKLGPIQLYASTGNLLTFSNPWEARTADYQVGMNLVFGRSGKKKE